MVGGCLGEVGDFRCPFGFEFDHDEAVGHASAAGREPVGAFFSEPGFYLFACGCLLLVLLPCDGWPFVPTSAGGEDWDDADAHLVAGESHF